MPKVDGEIASFLQGISEQPPSVRLTSQLETQENAVPSLASGLRKRPPMKWVKDLYSTPNGLPKMHFAVRDETEQYIIMVADGSIRVFDRFTGVEQTVNTPNGVGYISNMTPRRDLSILTINDYTFIANSKVTVAASGTPDPAHPFSAMIEVKSGNYSSRYAVYINGIKHAEVITDASTVEKTQTDWIATEIVSQLTTSLGAGWAFHRTGPTIRVRKTDSSAFSAGVWDSLGNNALSVTTGTVQEFSDLPHISEDGFKVRVFENLRTDNDDYHVKFVGDDNNSVLSKGTWEETRIGGFDHALDDATMPHVLVRESDGTFTFRQANWAERQVGDNGTNPWPSFIGNTITHVNLFQNRLVLLSDTFVVMSRVGNFFDFFRKTARALLDDDPIDLTASYSEVAKLYNAETFDGQLIVFSDTTQWSIKGSEILTPVNVSMSLLASYASSPNLEPVSLDRFLYFVGARGNSVVVKEMKVIDDRNRLEAVDLNDHCPEYLPAALQQMAGSPTEQMLVMGKIGSNELFVYNFHWGNRTKSQSAWHKFTFGANTDTFIMGLEFRDSVLDVVVEKEGVTSLYTIDFELSKKDPNQSFQTHLDFRLTEADCAVNVGSTKTTITLPIPLTNPVVVRKSPNEGSEIDTTVVNPTTITVPGSLTEFFVGEKYTMKVVPSQLFPRLERGDDGQARTEGQLLIQKLKLRFTGTGHLDVIISDAYRADGAIKYRGGQLGASNLRVGDNRIQSGTLDIPVHRAADGTTLTFQSDSPMPTVLVNARWSGRYIEERW